MQHSGRWPAKRPNTPLVLLLLASVALLAAACGAGDALMATITLPTSETAPPAADGAASSESPALAVPGTEGQSLTVTHQQRGYLDALAAAGRKPSSEFLALSIGSYVCQAHAAKQSEQAVRDHVLPLVRSDVSASFSGSVPPPAAEVDAAAADYIRIATERLC